MPPSSPRMPEKLAAAAFELFAQRGFDAVKLDEVAAAAGVTKGSLYCHYENKHQLMLAACARYYRRYHRRLHAEIATLTDPLVRLRRVVELSVRTCVIDQANRMFTTEIFARLAHDAAIRRSWAQFYDAVRETYIGLVSAAAATGAIECDDPRGAVDRMLETMEGVKLRAAFEPQLAAPDEQRAIARTLMRLLGDTVYTPASAST